MYTMSTWALAKMTLPEIVDAPTGRFTDPTDPDPRKPVWGWSEAQHKGTLTPAQRQALRDRLRAAMA